MEFTYLISCREGLKCGNLPSSFKTAKYTSLIFEILYLSVALIIHCLLLEDQLPVQILRCIFIIHHRSVQILDTQSLGQLDFVWRCLIFVNPDAWNFEVAP
jgi:hypothetical protein